MWYLLCIDPEFESKDHDDNEGDEPIEHKNNWDKIVTSFDDMGLTVIIFCVGRV